MLTLTKVKKYGLIYSEGTMSPNLFSLPLNSLMPNIDDAGLFNEIYQDVLKTPGMKKFKRTDSGGISLKNLILPAYDCQILTMKNGGFKGVELVVLTGRFQFRLSFTGRPHTTVCGNRAFNKLKQYLKKEQIDLESYFLANKEEGLEWKSKIPQPLIKINFAPAIDETIEGCHHIDFHSSYAAGLMNAYPEFAKVLKKLYKLRKEHPEYKEVLNCSIGYFQSQYIGYKLAHLSYAAITDNNNRVERLAAKVARQRGCVVLLFNTDGFWYKGPLFHDTNEGEELGQWHHDHVNCTLRIKSAGAYEYIEAGEYYPVMRGSTYYDRIKAREEWEWGDIYRDDCKPITFEWMEGSGVVNGKDS